jgi:hypothetical protein
MPSDDERDYEVGYGKPPADQPFIPDLDPQRVKENQRIDLFQRAGLPGGDLLQHRIGDGADQIRRDLDAVEIAQMADDLARAHAARQRTRKTRRHRVRRGITGTERRCDWHETHQGGAGLPGLTAGGRWIRTIGPSCKKRVVLVETRRLLKGADDRDPSKLQPFSRGTGSSNPSPSSSESANPRFRLGPCS